jgi:cyclophilin family peptidyl-prolyl cis-trans isomerase
MMLAVLILMLGQASPSASPSPSPSPKGPVVVLETSMGRIRIGLDPEKAPITVANFLKYVRSDHYNGTIFHRVMPGFMIQGGGFDAQFAEKRTSAPIRNEAKNGLRNLRGTIAMARTNDPNSATAQFFINVKNNAPLDFGVAGPGYAVFGEVLEGMDVVDRIVGVRTGSRGPHQDVPEAAILIKSARVEGEAARPAAKPLARPSGQPSAKPSTRP